MAIHAKSIGFTEQAATPATPPTGTQLIYMKTDGKFYRLDDTGTETEVGVGGGGGGDVFGPATNTQFYVPVWSAINSKTLLDGVPYGMSGASVLLQLDEFGDLPPLAAYNLTDIPPDPRIMDNRQQVYIGGIVEGAGTVSISGNDVTGTGTSFSAGMVNIESIIIDGYPYRIIGYTSPTSIAILNSPNDSYTDATYLLTQPGTSETGDDETNGFASLGAVSDYYSNSKYRLPDKLTEIDVLIAPRVYSGEQVIDLSLAPINIETNYANDALSGYPRAEFSKLTATVLAGNCCLSVASVDLGSISVEAYVDNSNYVELTDLKFVNYSATTAFSLRGFGIFEVTSCIVPDNIFQQILFASDGCKVMYGKGSDPASGITSDGVVASNATSTGVYAMDGSEVVKRSGAPLTGTGANSEVESGGIIR